jgi:hypothetical protein
LQHKQFEDLVTIKLNGAQQLPHVTKTEYDRPFQEWKRLFQECKSHHWNKCIQAIRATSRGISASSRLGSVLLLSQHQF